MTKMARQPYPQEPIQTMQQLQEQQSLLKGKLQQNMYNINKMQGI